MPRSLGLTLYGLVHRGVRSDACARPGRPEGRLIWLDAAEPHNLPALKRLASRLQALEGGPRVLLTSPDPVEEPQLLCQPRPADTAADARLFLDHWAPDAAVLTDGELRPALLHEARARDVPLLLLDATTPRIMRGRDGWWPGMTKTLVAGFRAIHAVDDLSAAAFRRAGAAPGTVRVTGRMEHPSAALPCTEAERAALALLLSTRPVWFAAGLPEAEESAVIEAHRAALRLAHRLLLIISTQDPGRVGPLSARMEAEENWFVASRAAEEEPEPDMQVYLTDGCTEFGLWYRLAPVTYLGGSLSTLGCLRDPMEAAALGSAILHGPRVGRHAAGFARLGQAHASVGIRSGATLGAALGEMLAPDRTARLAQAAWTVASDGTEATDRAMAVIAEVLGAHQARSRP